MILRAMQRVMIGIRRDLVERKMTIVVNLGGDF